MKEKEGNGAARALVSYAEIPKIVCLSHIWLINCTAARLIIHYDCGMTDICTTGDPRLSGPSKSLLLSPSSYSSTSNQPSIESRFSRRKLSGQKGTFE